MKSISLLPEQVRNYQKTSKTRNSIVLASLAGILIFLAIYLILSVSLSSPQGGLDAIVKEKAEVQAKIDGMKQYEDILRSAQAREALASKAMGGSPDWSGIFKEAFSKLPANVWVTGIRTQYTDGNGILEIDGKATDYRGLSEWLSVLQAVEGLKDARCLYTSTDVSNGSSGVVYQISAGLLPGPGYKVPETALDKSAGGKGNEG